jgi:hypothetical protein
VPPILARRLQYPLVMLTAATAVVAPKARVSEQQSLWTDLLALDLALASLLREQALEEAQAEIMATVSFVRQLQAERAAAGDVFAALALAIAA